MFATLVVGVKQHSYEAGKKLAWGYGRSWHFKILFSTLALVVILFIGAEQF